MIIIGRPVTFRIVNPYWPTSIGRFGAACAMRFCTLTWSTLGSVSTPNDTVSVIVPSFEFVDCM